MGKLMTLRLEDEQYERLQRAAERLGRPPEEMAARLLEERLREREFPFIEFRDTIAGAEAFLQGTRVKVWHLVIAARACRGDPAKIAAYLELPEHLIVAGLEYAAAFPDEIETALTEQEQVKSRLKEILPDVIIKEFDFDEPDEAAP